MKHSTIFMIGLVLAVFLLGTSALMQQDVASEIRQPGPVLDVTQESYVSDGTHHKLIVAAEDEATYAALRDKGAIVEEVNYGSFKMLIVNQQPLGGRAVLQALPNGIQDNMNLIPLSGYILDTTNPDATYSRLPGDLRRPDIADALARGTQPQGGLYIVQFIGPIRDEWLDALKVTGVEVVTYVPSNAYIVRADSKAASRALALLKQNPAVQFVGDYEPAFRLSPELQAARTRPGDTIDITVQVIDGADAKQTIANLTALANETVQTYRVLNYQNVELKVTAGRLAQIASLDGVFAVEERTQRRKLDEAQGQIVAGNLSGNSPTGPGYLAWLASKGFTSSQFTSFSVNVADDTYTLQGHPDLTAGRVAFENNPTAQSGALGGHGFLNAHIIGGFNNGTGTAVEDALGFNYGLGIAPWARVGVTAIFGSGASSGTTWENTAYGQGARISSNSWGFTNLFRYDTNAQAYDRIVRDAQTGVAGLQQMSIVFAAGNDGPGTNTVSSPSTAKNVICVGASENVRQTGTDGCAVANSGADSANDIIGFSSRGPVNSAGGDGRIMPHIVAPGTHIEAGVPQSNYNGSSV
ncbi:MAG TPA: S8 family serine peptidase, partial [Blastocatellia bacterium]